MAELSQHPDVVDLAEYAEDLLDDPRRAAVEQHVRGCPDCTATLADLAGLPQTLATAPIPPLPADVAQRLDQAIAAESASRASGWSGTARVTPLRPKRRWLAPVAAAAAVIGAVAIAVPVVNSGSDTGTDDAGSEVQSSREADVDDGGAFEEDDKGAAQPGPADQAPVIPLTSESFGRDVIDGFYGGSSDLRSRDYSTSVAGPPNDRYGRTLSSLPELCGDDASHSVPNGQVDDVTYDGEPARLLRLEAGRFVDAIAFHCEDDDPTILDATTLRPRS
jgi:Putative zinc-finger